MQLRDHREDLERAGGRVVLIGLGGPRRAGAFCREHGLAFACLSDPTRSAHEAYGLVRGVGRTLAPRNLGRFIGLNRRAETRQHRAGGDVWQQGGMFVVDRAGMVRYAHRNEDPGDHAPIDEVIAALAEALS